MRRPRCGVWRQSPLASPGTPQPWPPLVAEHECEASEKVIEALTMIGDEDAIVHLGRCAENHPALAGTVLGALREMDSARAQRLVRHLEPDGPASEAAAHEAHRKPGIDGR